MHTCGLIPDSSLCHPLFMKFVYLKVDGIEVKKFGANEPPEFFPRGWRILIFFTMKSIFTKSQWTTCFVSKNENLSTYYFVLQKFEWNFKSSMASLCVQHGWSNLPMVRCSEWIMKFVTCKNKVWNHIVFKFFQCSQWSLIS